MALSGSVADLPRSETSTLETPSPLKRCLWAADDVADSLDFSLADETDSFEQAFHLVHDQYVWRGYMNAEERAFVHSFYEDQSLEGFWERLMAWRLAFMGAARPALAFATL